MWLATDYFGRTRLYTKQPIKNPPSLTWATDGEFLEIGNKFENITWDDDPIEVNLISNECLQAFGDKCYDRGYADCSRFEYGKLEEGNLYCKDYFDNNSYVKKLSGYNK